MDKKSERTDYVDAQSRRAIGLLAAGVLLALLGVALHGWIGDEVFNTRIVTGLGILLIGIGISYWVRYRALRKDTPESARLINEERDERARMLRAKAGNRAFWVMMALAYAGLMWVSFASNGSLPMMSSEALWWFLAGLVGGRTVTSPTVSDDTVFATRGKRGPLFAVPLSPTLSPSTAVERSRRDILWTDNQGTPDACSPVAGALLLFTVTDDGIGRCYDTQTGKQKWKQRLTGEYKASPIIVEGRVLFLNTAGLCTIVSAASRFDKLAENQLDDQMLASPVVALDHIYLRGRRTLYCIGRSFR